MLERSLYLFIRNFACFGVYSQAKGIFRGFDCRVGPRYRTQIDFPSIRSHSANDEA